MIKLKLPILVFFSIASLKMGHVIYSETIFDLSSEAGNTSIVVPISVLREKTTSVRRDINSIPNFLYNCKYSTLSPK